MKKIIILSFMILVASFFASAKNNDITLDSSITEVPLEYELYRKIDDGLTLIENESVYTIDNLNPLTTNTMITDFTIRVNSNLNSSKNVNVTVSPSTFKTILNNDQIYDSNIKPIINTIIDRKTVQAGLNTNKEVYRFNIFVCGKKNLPAGKYICNVNVQYTIE